MRLALALIVILCSTACGSPLLEREPAEQSVAEEEETRPALSFTHWTEATELFIELPALVQGLPSPCAAHVTALADFSAPAAGRVTVVLR